MAACAASSFAQATQASLPNLKEGDRWVLQLTQERSPNLWSQNKYEVKVLRVSSKDMLILSKQAESTQPGREQLVGRDWSEFRNLDGVETTVYKPLAFPLKPGASWDVNFTHNHPNKDAKSVSLDLKYTVVGNEDVTVPAGQFNAIKIEGEGRWSDELEPTRAVTQGARSTGDDTTMVSEASARPAIKRGGRMYRQMWYVPAVKRWVKAVEEQYQPDGSRFERKTFELVSFDVGDAPHLNAAK